MGVKHHVVFAALHVKVRYSWKGIVGLKLQLWLHLGIWVLSGDSHFIELIADACLSEEQITLTGFASAAWRPIRIFKGPVSELILSLTLPCD